MTKAQIQTLSNNNIADDSNILPEEHREVNDALISEMYSDTFLENSLVPAEMTVLEKVVNSSTTYVNFFFIMKKEADKCYVKGNISNGSTQSIGYGLTIANIINTDFEARDTNVGALPYIQAIEARSTLNGTQCLILINNDIISINGLIPAEQTVTFDTFYLLKE